MNYFTKYGLFFELCKLSYGTRYLRNSLFKFEFSARNFPFVDTFGNEGIVLNYREILNENCKG